MSNEATMTAQDIKTEIDARKPQGVQPADHYDTLIELIDLAAERGCISETERRALTAYLCGDCDCI
jgi:hypothetical protein